MRGSGWPSRMWITATASINMAFSSASSPSKLAADRDPEPLAGRGSTFTFGAVADDDAAEEPLACVCSSSAPSSSAFVSSFSAFAAGLARIVAGAGGAAGASGGRTAAAGLGAVGRGAAAIAARGAGGRVASGGAPATGCAGAGAGASSAVVFDAMATTPRDGGRDA